MTSVTESFRSLSSNTSFSPFEGQIEMNRQLAEKIVGQAAGLKGIKYIRQICSSDDFLIDPTVYLINEMIERYVGMCRMDDSARAYVSSRIPGFMDKVTSTTYLRNFAVHYFEADPNRLKIMQVFERSIQSIAFHNDLKKAIDLSFPESESGENFRFDAEEYLRIALTVFHQSRMLKEYRTPEEDASLE